MPNLKKKRNELITCDECGKSRSKTYFNRGAIMNWNACNPLNKKPIHCKSCTGESIVASKGLEFFCMGQCQHKRPEFHFDERSLVQWLATDITKAICLRCTLIKQMVSQEEAYNCRKCKQTKHISQFGYAAIREWNRGKSGRLDRYINGKIDI